MQVSEEAARAMQADGRNTAGCRGASTMGEADRHGQRVQQEARAEEGRAAVDDSLGDKPNLANETEPATRTKTVGGEEKIEDPKLGAQAGACPLEAETKARGSPGRSVQ